MSKFEIQDSDFYSYSVRNESTGFAVAAFMDWTLIVSTASVKTTIVTSKNIVHSILI